MIKSLGVTFWYGLICAGFVVVVIFELMFVSSHLQEISTSETQVKSDLNILKERLETLRNVGPEITDSVTATTQALPTENSALILTSQIRRFANTHLLTVKNLTLSIAPQTSGSDLSYASVSFSTDSQTKDLLEFIKDLLLVSPVISFDALNVATTESGSIAQFSINSFWSPLPAKLPALTEPLVDLSDDEKTMLSLISQRIQPSFNEASESGIATNSGNTKSNPFAPSL